MSHNFSVDSQDVNTKKHKRRHQCKKKYCKRKGAKLIKETDVVLSSDRIDDDDFENDVHEDDNSATPDKIRILKLSDCDTSGGFCINIENVGQHLLLYLASQFSVEGCTAGSSILSTSDLNLTLIEERKTEYITRSEDKVEEKCIHIGLDENRYVVIKSHKYGDKVRKICGNLEFENAKYLLFDGAGIILMRYMAITNFKGRVELTTMLINGDIAKVCIQSSGYKKAWVCNSIKRVIEIEKTIIENCGIVQKSLTVLLPDGRMVKHEWEGCDYIIHMNPISNISGNLSSSWENDIELLSRYLDYKSKRKADHKSYMLDAPEAQTILSDYLQYILLTKPSNVLNYTIDYFKCMRPY